MQSSSIICSHSNFLSPSLAVSFSSSQQFPFISRQKHISCGANFLVCNEFPTIYTSKQPSCRFTLHSTVTEEHVNTSSSPSGYVETGYIFGVHGLHGEVRVKSTTDFPELRFSQPGIRWLKQQISGLEALQEIELVEGRGHPGQSWIVRFDNINTVEQAQKLVGSTILVRDEDRPVLEEGEFYTYDLIGMRVILKASGEHVGTVVNVFDNGAGDLLQVKLNTSKAIPEQIKKSKPGLDDSAPVVWVPFVEPIVPIVDLEKREMLITPPKGLLELNIRSDERSKKERRELEWKERKKFQRRLIAAKKKLHEMEQEHVFLGFRYGEKDQRSLLANQIVNVNSRLLLQALQNIETLATRHNLTQISSAVPRSNTLKVSDQHFKFKSVGQSLTSSGKVAIILVLDEIKRSSGTNLVDSKEKEDVHLCLKALLEESVRFVKIDDCSSVPLLLVSSAHSVNSLRELFADHDYFSFDPEKVWFLEEEKLPVVSSLMEGHEKHKILMKSPWEFLQKPIGSGGVVSLLSSPGLLDELSEMGIEYIEVCSVNKEFVNGDILLGLVHSCEAEVGVQLLDDVTSKEDFDLIFSMNFVKRLVNKTNKLRFDAVLASNPYVEMVDKEWVDVTPSSPNSYEFRCSIYSCLDASPISKVCVLDSTV